MRQRLFFGKHPKIPLLIYLLGVLDTPFRGETASVQKPSRLYIRGGCRQEKYHRVRSAEWKFGVWDSGLGVLIAVTPAKTIDFLLARVKKGGITS